LFHSVPGFEKFQRRRSKPATQEKPKEERKPKEQRVDPEEGRI